MAVNEPPSSEITPPEEALAAKTSEGRRRFLKNAALFTGTTVIGGGGLMLLVTGGEGSGTPAPVPDDDPMAAKAERPAAYTLDDKWTSYENIATYNNFYEFGLSKGAPAKNAGTLRPEPWKIRVEGEVNKPQTIDLDAIRTSFTLQERVYRMRCVEAWSMVIPWLGFPLAELIKRVEPTSRAKYVAFTTLYDPEQMPNQSSSVLDWPYVEALRIDEATHPLTMLATGLYGKKLPNQNGAPVRLVVPWKYGFKGIKSIVSIVLTEKKPPTTWNLAAPNEYGFYANVNPKVAHPRWSQATERRIGEAGKRDTLMYNGYADEVAHLYSEMDLRLHF